MSPVQGDHTCKNQRQPYQLYHESTFGFVGLYGVRINLLQFFQTLVHSQSIGQCSSSLNSSFIQFKTVEEIIPELVQAVKINYYSCFMSKLLTNENGSGIPSDEQLSKDQRWALLSFINRSRLNVGFYPMSIACLQLKIDSGGGKCQQK